MDKEKCCGNCLFMVDEDIYGRGYCFVKEKLCHCGDKCNEHKYRYRL